MPASRPLDRGQYGQSQKKVGESLDQIAGPEEQAFDATTQITRARSEARADNRAERRDDESKNENITGRKTEKVSDIDATICASEHMGEARPHPSFTQSEPHILRT